MEKADFERNRADPDVDLLDDLFSRKVPHVELAPVLALGNVGRVEAPGEGGGFAELGRDHRVDARLVPEHFKKQYDQLRRNSTVANQM